MAKLKRIGAIIPATNPVVEMDFYTAIPLSTGISVHFERMYNGQWANQPPKPEEAAYRVKMSQEEMTKTNWVMFGINQTMMNADVERSARSLANIHPDVIAYACTGGTWHQGNLAYDRQMAELIHQSSGGVPSVTAVGSCIEAMRAMGTRRISVAGPYRNHHLQTRLKPLLEEAGFEVVSVAGEPWMQQSVNPAEIDEQDPQVIIDFALTVARPEADTVFLPGTAWRALEAAEELERRLKKTVITVNQATLWNALRTIGATKPIPGYGKLLRNIPALAKTA